MPDIAICVPAREEAERLPALLGALRRLDRGTIKLSVCILLDGCGDESEAIVHEHQRSAPYDVHIAARPGGPPNAGDARAAAMRLAIANGVPDLMLTTDADSLPAADWLRTMASALTCADVVTGLVRRSAGQPSPAQDRIERYYDALFAWRRRLDPVAWEAPVTHHHAGGANMGFRTSAYRSLGGFAAIPSGEDGRIVDDAGRAGWRVRRDARCVVVTSDRRQGRAPGGLAAALREVDAGGDAVRVAHPCDLEWQYRGHAAARRCFVDGRPESCAPTLGMDRLHVRGVARDCPNAEAFAMRLVPEPPGGIRTVPLAVAERVLARRSAVERTQAA